MFSIGGAGQSALGEEAKCIHIDNDIVDGFVKENFNNLRTDAEVLARRTPTDPDLRLLIPQLIAGYALKEGYSAIVTASHPKRVIRQAYYDIARKNGARVVLLTFRVSDEQVLQRIKENNRDAAILGTAPVGGANFQDFFNNQKSLFEEPADAEKRSCFKALEVTEDNSSEVLSLAVSLLDE